MTRCRLLPIPLYKTKKKKKKKQEWNVADVEGASV